MSAPYQDRLEQVAAAYDTKPDLDLIADVLIDRVNAGEVQAIGVQGGNDKRAVVAVLSTVLESPAGWDAILGDAYLPPDVIGAAVDRANAERPESSAQQIFGRVVRSVKVALGTTAQ
jgi:hypothetical protein